MDTFDGYHGFQRYGRDEVSGGGILTGEDVWAMYVLLYEYYRDDVFEPVGFLNPLDRVQVYRTVCAQWARNVIAAWGPLIDLRLPGKSVAHEAPSIIGGVLEALSALNESPLRQSGKLGRELLAIEAGMSLLTLFRASHNFQHGYPIPPSELLGVYRRIALSRATYERQHDR